MNARLRSVAAVAGLVLCVAASAQQYPNKPIRFITVGADDAMPRILAQVLSGLGDLIELAEARPGQLNYSATSAGSTSMLTFEMFKASAHVNIVHVPYKSIAAALTDASWHSRWNRAKTRPTSSGPT